MEVDYKLIHLSVFAAKVLQSFESRFIHPASHPFIDLFLRELVLANYKLSRVRVLFLKGSSSNLLLSCLIYSVLRTIEEVRGSYPWFTGKSGLEQPEAGLTNGFLFF